MKKYLFPIALFIAGTPLFAENVPAPEIAETVAASATKADWNQIFADGLLDADGNAVSLAELKKKKFIGVYCSASWCGPCRQFTPQLVDFYKKNSDKIGIVLIGLDNSQAAVLKYMKDHEMPFFTAKHNSAGANLYTREQGVRGIPDFRVFKKNGQRVVEYGRDLDAVEKAIGGQH